MEIKSNDSNSGAWVDEKMASLQPDSEWNPNSAKAFERLMEIQRTHGRNGIGTRPVGRLIMATTLSLLIGLVVIILPWKHLMESGNATKSQPVERSAPVQHTPEPAQIQTQSAPEQVKQGGGGGGSPSAQDLEDLFASELNQSRNQYGAAVQTRQETTPTPEQNPEAPKENQAPAPTDRPWNTPPKCSRMEPNYTSEARAARIEGQIKLLATIHTDGTVTVEKVVTGLGYGLDESAVKTVQNWMCEPATKDGKPVDATLQISLNFRLY